MDNRDEFLAMLSKAEKGEIEAIVVLRLDRLGRDVADTTTTIKLLNAYGCTLLAGDDIANNNTPVGEFMRGILLCQNQYHARVTASRVMQGEIHNVQHGDSAGGQPPYGLKIVNKQYEIDEDEAPAIRKIFSMIAKRKQLQAGYRPLNRARLQNSTRQRFLLLYLKLSSTQRKILRYLHLQP